MYGCMGVWGNESGGEIACVGEGGGGGVRNGMVFFLLNGNLSILSSFEPLRLRGLAIEVTVRSK